MIQIGRYKLGFASLSMIVVFIVLSICATVAAFQQARPECPMPLSHIILINEGMALLTTLIYGIFPVFVTFFSKKINNRLSAT